ncbi:MAG: tryptophan synthase subunit alpha [Demequinaceae bacterium]|nr:tryptophan synthase subunit alpha [Demequinaceae bacterium]
MSALTDCLRQARAEGRAALLAYLPVGFPSVEGSIEAMRTMVDAGADIVEVGIPYSDPVLDGPIIEHAGEAALKAGVRVSDAFVAVKAVSEVGAFPIVMTYYNPILQYGLDRFALDLAAAGGVGVITPDLTPDIGRDWRAAAARHGLDSIFLVAPSTTPERLHMTVEASTGFVYATSLMGVTGERSSVGNQAEKLVNRTREAGAEFVCIGLGVSSGTQASEIAQYADGVIVGSAFVRALAEAPNLEEGLKALRGKVSEIAEGARKRT